MPLQILSDLPKWSVVNQLTYTSDTFVASEPIEVRHVASSVQLDTAALPLAQYHLADPLTLYVTSHALFVQGQENVLSLPYDDMVLHAITTAGASQQGSKTPAIYCQFASTTLETPTGSLSLPCPTETTGDRKRHKSDHGDQAKHSATETESRKHSATENENEKHEDEEEEVEEESLLQGQASREEEEEELTTFDLTFRLPSTATREEVDALYEAFCDCAELHPAVAQSDDEGEDGIFGQQQETDFDFSQMITAERLEKGPLDGFVMSDQGKATLQRLGLLEETE